MRNSLEATGCRELLGDGLVPRKPGKEVSMQERLRSYVFIIAGMGLLTFAGCGGGPTGTPPTPTAYTIGGTVSGLSGRGLMLQDNGGDDLPVSADEAFTFTTSIPSGGVYAVTVLTQPSSPAQSCGWEKGVREKGEKGVRYLFRLYSPCPADDPALSVRSSREKVPDTFPDLKGT
jgi:hypothetical protein